MQQAAATSMYCSFNLPLSVLFPSLIPRVGRFGRRFRTTRINCGLSKIGFCTLSWVSSRCMRFLEQNSVEQTSCLTLLTRKKTQSQEERKSMEERRGIVAAAAEDEDFLHPPSRSRTSSPTVMTTRPHTTNRSSFDTDEDGAPSFVSIQNHPDDDQRHGEAADERRQKRLRIAVVVIGAVLIALVTADAFTTQYLEQAVAAFVEWLAGHPAAGVLAVILVYIVATVCFVPGSVLTIGVGYAFGRAFDQHLFLGVLLASTAVFVGASSGSLCCLLLGRYLFRAPVLRLAAKYPVFRAIDRALEGNGFQIMLLLRLSPLIPYNALDYISGVTSISIVHYSLALLGLVARDGGLLLHWSHGVESRGRDGGF